MPSVFYLPKDVTGSTITTVSSWDPTWEMEFKPQIGAPGSYILSTYPVALGGYAVMSGTSMSCSLTAAIIALISEVRGTFDPELVTNLLSFTAKPQLFSDGTNLYDIMSSAPQQGGGLVQAYDAAYTTSLLSPYSLYFNDTEHLATKLNFTITNKGSRAVTYELGQVASITIITLPAGHSTVVSVTAEPPAGIVDPKRLALWSGYVSINGTDGSVLLIPYQGLTGSLRKATVVAPDQAWVFHSTEITNFPALPPATNHDDLTTVYTNLALGCKELHVDIVPVQNGTNATGNIATAKPIGQIFGMPAWLQERGMMAYYPWDGKLDSGLYAPAGHCRFVVRALSIFGDVSNPEDWDVATTQSMILEYKQ
ncbi:hypothetical protein E4U59_002940 [Claviceps monticola]|nr:hypothetical protein E4U59_002940 [Claviceps monticola]